MMDKQEVRQKAMEFLRKQSVASVATVSASGEPEAASVVFLADNEFNIYFVTSKGSRKAQNIVANKKVAIAIGTDIDHPSTIQIQGNAEVVPKDQLQPVIEMAGSFIEKGKTWWPLLKVGGLEFVVVKVRPDWVRWLNLDVAEHPETYREDFYQIIP